LHKGSWVDCLHRRSCQGGLHQDQANIGKRRSLHSTLYETASSIGATGRRRSEGGGLHHHQPNIQRRTRGTSEIADRDQQLHTCKTQHRNQVKSRTRGRTIYNKKRDQQRSDHNTQHQTQKRRAEEDREDCDKIDTKTPCTNPPTLCRSRSVERRRNLRKPAAKKKNLQAKVPTKRRRRRRKGEPAEVRSQVRSWTRGQITGSKGRDQQRRDHNTQHQIWGKSAAEDREDCDKVHQTNVRNRRRSEATHSKTQAKPCATNLNNRGGKQSGTETPCANPPTLRRKSRSVKRRSLRKSAVSRKSRSVKRRRSLRKSAIRSLRVKEPKARRRSRREGEPAKERTANPHCCQDHETPSPNKLAHQTERAAPRESRRAGDRRRPLRGAEDNKSLLRTRIAEGRLTQLRGGRAKQRRAAPRESRRAGDRRRPLRGAEDNRNLLRTRSAEGRLTQLRGGRAKQRREQLRKRAGRYQPRDGGVGA
jgi:hypothetical protein